MLGCGPARDRSERSQSVVPGVKDNVQMTQPIIEVSNLLKRFGPLEVLNHISFSILEGESVGLLGENGAGKTTTMRILAGFLPPTSGTVLVAGHDTVYDSRAMRRSIGYLPENVPLYPSMRVEEYLNYRAKLKGVSCRDAKTATAKVLERVDLTRRRRSLIGTLSKGLKQRVGIADALVHSPPLLILDEPTSGLDPSQRVDVRNLIAELKGEHTILVSSHILNEVENSCDRVIVLSNGGVVAAGSIAELRGDTKSDCFQVTYQGDEASATAAIERLAGLTHKAASRTRDSLRHTLDIEISREGTNRGEVVKALTDAQISIHEVRSSDTSLEAVFLKLVGQKEESDS